LGPFARRGSLSRFALVLSSCSSTFAFTLVTC
jgi:hypothetical protein